MPTARTSESHPLRITAMTLGDGRGRIGFSQCPGRIDRCAISGPWKRDLDTDLDAIQRWGATAVVSLIIHEEIAYLKVHDLPRAVRDRHMEWWHAPIPDGEAPEQDFEHAWKATGESIRNRLRLGFDVLLHCRGGLGRAGTIAARLLVELGVQPDDAIRRVRDAHEGTIENDSQLAHVRQCSAQAPSVPSQTADDIHDRALGAFLGLAVGRRGRHDARILLSRYAAASRRHGRWRPLRSAGRCLDRRHGHGAGPCRQPGGIQDARLPGPDGPFREVVARRRLLVEAETASTSETRPAKRSPGTYGRVTRSRVRPIHGAQATAR